MLNNKGFAVSTVLYTLLIAFLMFLGAALAQFSSSSSLVGKANDDLVNGTNFEVMQVKPSGIVYDSNKNPVFYDDADGEKKELMYVCLGQNKSKNSKQYFIKNQNDFIRSEFLSNEKYWYETNTMVRIKSRYGTMYWPKDFGLTVNPSNGNIEGNYHSNKNIDVSCIDGSHCEGKNLFSVTYTNKELKIPLEKVTYTTPSWTYNGGTILLKDEDVDKFKNIFNSILEKESYNFECSTNIIKANGRTDGCNEILNYRKINFDDKDGFIKLYIFGPLLSQYEFEVYMWNLTEPISFTHFEDNTDNGVRTINRIFYTIYKTDAHKGSFDLAFYDDDEELFTYNHDKLQSYISASNTLETITTNQKLNIKDSITEESINNFGLHDICE